MEREGEKVGVGVAPGVEANGGTLSPAELASPNGGSNDHWAALFYRPRTVRALVAGSLLLVWASGALEPLDNRREADAEGLAARNARDGVLAMIAVYLGYSLLQAPDTALKRPHPAVWRFVHGASVVYLLFLVYLLFQTVDDARLFMRNLSPELGVALPERAYGDDCRVYTPEKDHPFANIRNTVLDEFVVAHLLGWWGKALIIRNTRLLWVMSILFELLEKTFQHMLPNFNECWWDSWLLDFALCNALGIWLGMRTVRHFEMTTYAWEGKRGRRRKQQLSLLQRGLDQFTPATWDRYSWRALDGPRRFIQVLFLLLLIEACEVNCFFLKGLLWVPPRNYLNTARLSLWFLIALPAVFEYYHFIDADEGVAHKMGPYAWMAFAIIIAEILVEFKFGRGEFPQPWPKHVLVAWGMVGAAFVIFLPAWAIRQHLHHRRLHNSQQGGVSSTANEKSD
eukprot:jgi/Chlat1/4251/Chrsp27S04325